MASSIGFRNLSFLPSCLLFKLRGLNFYPGGTLTHCSCQPSLDAHFTLLIRPTSSKPVCTLTVGRVRYSTKVFGLCAGIWRSGQLAGVWNVLGPRGCC